MILIFLSVPLSLALTSPSPLPTLLSSHAPFLHFPVARSIHHLPRPADGSKRNKRKSIIEYQSNADTFLFSTYLHFSLIYFFSFFPSFPYFFPSYRNVFFPFPIYFPFFPSFPLFPCFPFFSPFFPFPFLFPYFPAFPYLLLLLLILLSPFCLLLSPVCFRILVVFLCLPVLSSKLVYLAVFMFSRI